MYLAELRGKVPSHLENSEDLLTSNVFSFFKYSDRTVYLKNLLKFLGITPSNDDLRTAEFLFWQSYDEGTEPDLVVIVGDHYLLFEAKHLSGFNSSGGKRSQLVREVEGGLDEAMSLGKKFMLIAITSDYVFQGHKFQEIMTDYSDQFKWMNWQTISLMLLELLEKHGSALPDLLFAKDLYHLLEKKRLRSFRPFKNIVGAYRGTVPERIFFSAESAQFRGEFIGFSKALSTLPKVDKSKGNLFYSKKYFSNLQFNFDISQCEWFRKRGE
jgi:hypothetical protein